MLCCIEADLSAAPYKSKQMTTGMRYKRNYDVVLLVGLTELKAQVSWIDSKTVRARIVLCTTRIYFTNLHVRESRGQKEGP